MDAVLTRDENVQIATLNIETVVILCKRKKKLYNDKFGLYNKFHFIKFEIFTFEIRRSFCSNDIRCF